MLKVQKIKEWITIPLILIFFYYGLFKMLVDLAITYRDG